MKKEFGYVYFAPAVSYMALIFYLSSRPAPEVAGIFPMVFHIKTGHCLEYGFLALLLIYGFFKGTTIRPAAAYAWVIMAATAWGISDEIHQRFVPERTSTIIDAVSDLVGVAIFTGIHAWLSARRNTDTPNPARPVA